MERSKNRILELDGLRGFFAIMVLLFHYKLEYTPVILYDFFFIRMSGNFVTFFFVLSGFVITHNYQNNFSFQKFIKKRFIRLYPLLFYTSTIYFLVLLGASFLLKSSLNNSYTFGQIIMSYLDGILLTNSLPLFKLNIIVNPPNWSVSSEMFSYLFFAIICLFKNNSLRMVFAILSSFLGYNIYFDPTIHDSAFMGFLVGILSFNMGYFTWYLGNKINKNFDSKLQWLIPVIIIGAFYFLYNYEFSSHAKFFELVVLQITFAASILILIKTKGFLTSILTTNIFQKLGKWSYSIYLNHALLIIVVPKVFLSFFNNSFLQILILTITILLTVIYSRYTYEFVEKKYMNFKK